MAVSEKAADIAGAMVTTPVPLGDWLVVMPIVLTILGGVGCLMLRKSTELQPRLATVMLGLLVLSDIGLLVRVLDKGVITMVMGRWLAPFGIAFTVDVLSATLVLIAGIVAFATSLYGIADTDSSARRYGFYPFLMLLMTGVSGAFLTGDIFNLYVWFEVLLISSYGLLVLGSERAQLDGAVKYGILNLIATTLFLIATGYLYGLVGTLNMADIPGAVAALPERAPINTVATLYLIAFAMKAAAFPVNFWLPASYHTPRIAAAAIFAGLLTKVGIYALVRTMVMLLPEHRDGLDDIIAILAVATMLTGVLGAIAQADLRRMLGYLVISGIGSTMAGLAVGSALALSGLIFYAVHSIIVMTALYFVAGLIARASGGEFALARLGGLYGRAPLLAAVFFVLGLSVTGLPPFSGFWAKIILVDASLALGHGWLAASILVTGFLTSIAVARVGLFVFWRGGPEGTPDGKAGAVAVTEPADPAAAGMWIGLGLLVGLTVIIGLAPNGMLEVATRGAAGLLDPSGYVQSVFGGEGAR